jgi:serine/threonine protein kinase
MNVLVDETRSACIVDFGFTVAYTNSVAHSSSGNYQGTVGFTAPELLEFDVLDESDTAGYPTPQSDVYSLGSLIYEVKYSSVLALPTRMYN